MRIYSLGHTPSFENAWRRKGQYASVPFLTVPQVVTNVFLLLNLTEARFAYIEMEVMNLLQIIQSHTHESALQGSTFTSLPPTNVEGSECMDLVFVKCYEQFCSTK